MRQAFITFLFVWFALNVAVAYWLHRVRDEPRRVTTITFGDRSEAI